MVRSGRLSAVVVFVTFAAARLLPSQEPGVERFCDLERDEGCIPDSLEVRFGAVDGPSVREVSVDGDEVRAVVVLDTISTSIRTWSYAVSHDPAVLTILPDSVTMRGTDGGAFVDATRSLFDMTTAVGGGPDFPPGFVSAVFVGFAIQGGVEGFLDGLTIGQANSLAVASYRVTGEIPAAGTLLHFEDGVVRNEPSPPAPFPDCGVDATADDLDCPIGLQAGCRSPR